MESLHQSVCSILPWATHPFESLKSFHRGSAPSCCSDTNPINRSCFFSHILLSFWNLSYFYALFAASMACVHHSGSIHAATSGIPDGFDSLGLGVVQTCIPASGKRNPGLHFNDSSSQCLAGVSQPGCTCDVKRHHFLQ